MYYIFSSDGKCIARCSAEPNNEDLNSRDEFFVVSDNIYDITKLSYISEKFVTEDTQEDESVIYAKIEHSWVKSELKAVDTELMYHWTGDITRQSYTEEDWKLYAIALRDYTTIVDGIPVVNSESRPIPPHNTTLEE